MKHLLALGAAAVFVLAFVSVFDGSTKESNVCFGEDCFDVELALNNDQRARGLMYREKIENGSGMLFVFDNEGEYPFWMKNTLIPLDIIWMDSDGKVVFVEREAQPCTSVCYTINPKAAAKYVLEINSGLSSKIGIEVGDVAKIEYQE